MRDANNEFSLPTSDELGLLLALNREKKITPAQLERLDFLLQQRGRAIESHISLLLTTEGQAA